MWNLPERWQAFGGITKQICNRRLHEDHDEVRGFLISRFRPKSPIWRLDSCGDSGDYPRKYPRIISGISNNLRLHPTLAGGGRPKDTTQGLALQESEGHTVASASRPKDYCSRVGRWGAPEGLERRPKGNEVERARRARAPPEALAKGEVAGEPWGDPSSRRVSNGRCSLDPLGHECGCPLACGTDVKCIKEEAGNL